MNKRKTDEKVLYIIGWVIFLLIALFLTVYRIWPQVIRQFVMPCPLHMLTGLYCPGCGGTRAVLFLLRGRIITSLLYHPLVPFAAILGGWFMISHTIERISGGRFSVGMRYRDIYIWIALTLIVVNFLTKNFLLLCGIDLLALLG